MGMENPHRKDPGGQASTRTLSGPLRKILIVFRIVVVVTWIVFAATLILNLYPDCPLINESATPSPPDKDCGVERTRAALGSLFSGVLTLLVVFVSMIPNRWGLPHWLQRTNRG